MLWSTGPQGDPTSIAHRMVDDAHGRPGDPLCGRPLVGLWFRRDHTWDQVPPSQRCPACAELLEQHAGRDEGPPPEGRAH